ncbi:MAG: vitamin B12-dependent ribonucleotide reductase [Candidatus Aenigmarchaeota archaeon]|nr:vitamin B12-dependent ribonucleotide reductase [Candidatus Aenigmarchaeota archaeon]
MARRKLKKIKKRDGRIVDFDRKKIKNAIWAAARTLGGKDEDLPDKLSHKVVDYLKESLPAGEVPTVEKVQDAVEKILIEEGHARTAKCYILYRQKRAEIRRAKKLLGVEDDLKLSLNAITVLQKRYLKRDEHGNIIETPKQMFERVAKEVASAEETFKTPKKEREEIEGEFLRLMSTLEFLPNSPTLMNAGTGSNLSLSACFVLPVEDSIEGIFESVKNMAIIQQSGGGTGFSFTNLRPSGDVVKSTSGVASGPISFMKVFNTSTEIIKQGGKRRGANMGMLRVDHPDILDFIVCKETEGILNNFNISVALNDDFMKAVEENDDFSLINPRNGKPSKKVKARAIWNLIITMAWKNGEPGVVFIDRINKHNPTPHIGKIQSTNPCGEQPLLPYESCNLGSINLSKMTKDGKIDWDKLRYTIRLAVRFLDNVIEVNKFPLKELDEMNRKTRKIGLGVMGFADMLIKLDIPYNSEKGVKMARKVMKFIRDEGRKISEELGKERGSFDSFKGSVWEKKGYKYMRNATVTTIAPTGTIGVIAGCSQGCEPLFAISYVRNVRETIGSDLVYVNPDFEAKAIMAGIYDEEFMKKIARKSSVQGFEEIPKEIREVFVTAHDISPEWHVKMQGAFQKYTDNAVSKTINFPNHATPQDIEKAYLLAYELGCKGLTVYRDGSRKYQILTTNGSKDSVSSILNKTGGCATCEV